MPDAADRALVKLTRLLPAGPRARVAALTAATEVVTDPTRPASGPPPEPEIILTLAAAVRAHRRVRIVHHREGGEATTRDVDPYGVVVRGRHWYLVGHDHLREARRVYRIDRISAAEELPHRFTPPDGYDPIAHVLRALRLDAWRHRTEVWLDTELTTARAALPTIAGETHAAPGGGVLLVSGANDLDGVARMLCGLPWTFVVRQPPELVDALRRRVDELDAPTVRSGYWAARPAGVARPAGAGSAGPAGR
jgi:predicted DNA-binding transcriptional regulator YafY